MIVVTIIDPRSCKVRQIRVSDHLRLLFRHHLQDVKMALHHQLREVKSMLLLLLHVCNRTPTAVIYQDIVNSCSIHSSATPVARLTDRQDLRRGRARAINSFEMRSEYDDWK